MIDYYCITYKLKRLGTGDGVKVLIKSKNLWNVIKKVSFSLMIVFIYVMGTYIPLPFAEITKAYARAIHQTPFSILGVFTGANYARLSIFSVGINPLMFVMLIVQLLTMTRLFGFDALSQTQIQVFMQVLTLIFTVIQAMLLVFGLISQRNFFRDCAMIIILTAGSCLVVWLCFRNIKYGVGASAPVILTSILNGAIPNVIANVRMLMKFEYAWLWISLLVIFILLLVLFWMAFNKAYYPLRIINPSLPSKSKAMLVPIGLNMAAMMMYMVGMALLTLPIMISPYFPSNKILNSWQFSAIFSTVMAIALFYFFTFVSFDPKDQAKGMRNNHTYILGIKPGLPTQKYLRRLILIIAFPGAILNSAQLVLGLYGAQFLGRYAGFAIIPMNVVMIVMFMSGIRDQVAALLFPYKYDRLERDE